MIKVHNVFLDGVSNIASRSSYRLLRFLKSKRGTQKDVCSYSVEADGGISETALIMKLYGKITKIVNVSQLRLK